MNKPLVNPADEIDAILQDLLDDYALQDSYDFYYPGSEHFDEVVGKRHQKNMREAKEAIAALQTAARVDELLLACEYWEKNPTKPATYLIDRRAALTEKPQEGEAKL
jgi:hypothetical protein